MAQLIERLSPVRAAFRHEWRQLVHAPMTYVFQVCFLLALSIAIFFIGDFYNTDEASLRLLVLFLPWVAAILVPALAMRAWSASASDRSLELSLSLPLPLRAVVAGKFLAACALLLMTLACTAPFALTVLCLGEPDRGALFAGYIGAMLLLLSFLAVAQLASAVTGEPVSGFVLGVLALFILLLLGWELPQRFIKDWLPSGIRDVLTFISPSHWLGRFATGRIEVAGVALFGLLSAFALWASAAVIDRRRKGNVDASTLVRGAGRSIVALAVVGGAVAGLQRTGLALDMTAEREFTLHAGSIDVLRRLPPGVDVTYYWSADESSVPAGIKSHARRVRHLLSDLAERSGGRMAFLERNTAPDTDAEQEALALGMQRVPMTSGDSFIFGAVFRHGERAGKIAYFDHQRDGLLEYDVANTLRGLTLTRIPKVGILSPLITPSQLEAGREGLAVLSDLRGSYDVAVIPHFSGTLPEDLDVLVVIGATILKREMLYAIDQHVMRGAGLVVMMDPRLRMHPASDQVVPQPSEEIDDISDVLLKWGVRYESQAVVGDRRLAAPVMDSRQQQLLYPFWLRVGKDGLSRTHPATASLNEILLAESGAFVLSGGERTAPLVSTTAESGVLPVGRFASGQPEELASAFSSDGQARILVAAIRGPLISAFEGAPTSTSASQHRVASTGAAAVFAVADIDWLFDPFSVQTIDLGGRLTSRPLNDNAAFLANMIEYATRDAALIAMRSRGRLSRPFTRVGDLVREGQERIRDQEAGLVQRITSVEEQISKIPVAAGVSRIEQLPEALQSRIRELRVAVAVQKKTLRDLRRSAREQVERLGVRVMLVNLAAGPLLVVSFAMLMRWRRLIHVKVAALIH